MLRKDTRNAEKQMIHCSDCAQIMYGIYDRKARKTCSPCGGQALGVVNPKYPQPMNVKEKQHA